MTGEDLETWGKSVAEEALFRAGLGVSDASERREAAEIALSFTVRALEDEGALSLELERIGASPISLKILL